MGYNLLIKGVYWGYNPLTNHLLTSWDIQVGGVDNHPGWKSESIFKADKNEAWPLSFSPLFVS